MERLLNDFLTLIFKPLSIVGIKKCSRCTVRHRLAQLGLLVSVPIARVGPVKRARIRWDMTAHPQKNALVAAPLKLIPVEERVKHRKELVELLKPYLDDEKGT